MNSSFLMPEKPTLVTPVGTPAAMHKVVFSEENEFKEYTYKALGDLDDIELLFNDVLVLKYIRDQISPNLKAAAETQREDRWQGSVGLVLKIGPTAFQDDGNTKFPDICRTIKRGDWVMFRMSDGWDRDIQELFGFHHFGHCRLIQDAHIRAKVKYPGRLNATGG